MCLYPLYFDPCVMILTLLQLVQPTVQSEELRLLLSYISDFSDTVHDYKTSHQELSSLLKPFYVQP